MLHGQTPSQTIGPFFAYGLTPEQYGYAYTSIGTPELAIEGVDGERIRIEGRVLDGEGEAVGDAMIEIWQADAQGRYAHPADARRPNTALFTGFGRAGTGTRPDRCFWFDTIKPGTVDDCQAPHVNVVVFMRGLLTHLYTRIYFSDEAQANAMDPVLLSIPTERRATLIATRADDVHGCRYHIDIRMQGEQETVFFAP